MTRNGQRERCYLAKFHLMSSGVHLLMNAFKSVCPKENSMKQICSPHYSREVHGY